MKRKSKYNVVVVGVGVVGIEMLRVLRQRNFPVGDLRVLARSTREITVDGEKYSVKAISPEAFDGMDIALFAGTEGEKGAAVIYAPEAVKRGCVVIDNGADFRMDPKVPLVVPEVNAADVKKHKGIIANPNCSTIQMVVALYPIHRRARIKRIVVTTFQSVSGAGQKKVNELWEQSGAFLAKKPIKPVEFPYQIAFNLIPQIDVFMDNGYTKEEMKMVNETRKIMGDDSIKVNATCVRVPVFYAHSESVNIETEKYISANEVRELLLKAPGVRLVDDPMNRSYPMPINAEGKDDTFVGRIRRDDSVKNGISMWVVADNIRKGAALNAIQIAELL